MDVFVHIFLKNTHMLLKLFYTRCNNKKKSIYYIVNKSLKKYSDESQTYEEIENKK